MCLLQRRNQTFGLWDVCSKHFDGLLQLLDAAAASSTGFSPRALAAASDLDLSNDVAGPNSKADDRSVADLEHSSSCRCAVMATVLRVDVDNSTSVASEHATTPR